MGEENGTCKGRGGKIAEGNCGIRNEIVMKLVLLFGYLAIQWMLLDARKGWIGGIIFVCSIAVVAQYTAWKGKTNRVVE